MAIHAQRGADQGCPCNPALFATLIAGALERVRAGLRLLDESAAVLSYLDDIYIVVSPEHAGRALIYVEQSFSPLGLRSTCLNKSGGAAKPTLLRQDSPLLSSARASPSVGLVSAVRGRVRA